MNGMVIRLQTFWDALRNSLWFLPVLFTAAAAVGAPSLGYVDRQLVRTDWAWLGWIATTPGSAQATLSMLTGALATVGALVFSLTMVTLSQTSSQFGSRLLRTFLDHSLPQFTLAMFLATTVFCTLVLRMVKEGSGAEPFVPHLSVVIAMTAAGACLATLIAFFHHAVYAIQAEVVVSLVAQELDRSIDRLFPEQLGEPADDRERTAEDAEWPAPGAQWQCLIRFRQRGYLQAINGPALISLARKHNLVLRLLRRPGHFLREGLPLIDACGLSADRLSEEELAELQNCFLVGIRRTPRQDLECAVTELVEVAVRALSPGINDPFTAVVCIDSLGASLCRLAERKMPTEWRVDDDGNLRVIADTYRFDEVLDTALNQIRQHGRSSIAVSLRLLETIGSVATVARRAADRAALLRHGEMVHRAASGECREEHDQRVLDERLQQLREALSEFG